MPAWFRFPRHQTLIRVILAALALAGAGVMTMTDLHGPTMSVDSLFYASVARHFAQHGSLVQFDGLTLIQFPPGLSVLIGSLLALGFSMVAATAVINVTCFVVLVVAAFALVQILFNRPWLSLLSASLMTFTTPISSLYAVVWSEPVFITVLAVYLAVLASALRRQRLSRASVLTLVACVWAATALRYDGVALLPPLLLAGYLIARHAGATRVRALVRAGLLTAFASVMTIAIVLRNLALHTGPFGPTLPSATTPLEVARQVPAILGATIDPSEGVVTQGVHGAAGSPLLVTLGVLALLALVSGVVRALRHRDYAVLAIACYAAVFWAALIYASLTSTLFVMNNRLVAPSLPALFVVGLYGLVPVARYVRGHVRAVARLPLAALVLVMTFQAAGVVPRAVDSLARTTPPLTPVERVVAALPPGVGVAAPVQLQYGLYAATGHEPITGIQSENFYCPPVCVTDFLTQLHTDVADGTVRDVIFDTALAPGTIRFFSRHGVDLTLQRTGPGYALYSARVPARDRRLLGR